MTIDINTLLTFLQTITVPAFILVVLNNATLVLTITVKRNAKKLAARKRTLARAKKPLIRCDDFTIGYKELKLTVKFV